MNANRRKNKTMWVSNYMYMMYLSSFDAIACACISAVPQRQDSSGMHNFQDEVEAANNAVFSFHSQEEITIVSEISVKK